jgi:hypothetical protein
LKIKAKLSPTVTRAMDINTTTPGLFRFFPQLPLELQLSIWEAAINNGPPRNIVIRPLDGIQYLGDDHGNYYETGCRKRCRLYFV